MTRSVFVHLHTFDLRVHDSPSLHLSHDKSSSVGPSTTHFLPLYIFDPRQLDISHLPNGHAPIPERVKRSNGSKQTSSHGLPSNPNHAHGGRKTQAGPMSRVAGFHRTSPHRLKYLLESVYELRETYRQSGGDMLIGYGKPEVLVPGLVKALGGSNDVVGVWAQDEITVEEKTMLDKLSSALDGVGVGLHLHDSKTLIPRKNLPFKISQTPDVYTTFRKKVEDLGMEPGRGMLSTPLQTAKWDTKDAGGVQAIKVSVGQDGASLKPFPELELANIDVGERQGGWVHSTSEADTLEGMYAALSARLVDQAPVGGWTTASQGKKPPTMHKSTAIPFAGGEKAALSRLESYVGHQGPNGWSGGHPARTYKDTRNGMVGDSFSTKFAALLSLGVLSPKEAGYRVGGLLQTVGHEKHKWDNVYWILFELLWRDFFQFTAQKYAGMSRSSLFDEYGFSDQIDTYPRSQRPDGNWHSPDWENKDDPARLWCEGRTGVPFIDACMRELRETGYMSNRGRQNVASYLTKDLYIDWRVGAEFFEMHLVDYDTCSNWGNWQYQAGVGNDPRSSRQFNPIKQAADYDKHGEYVRFWLPELKDVPDEFIQTPWLLGDASRLNGYPARPISESPSWRKFYPRNAKSHGGGGGGGGGGYGSGGRDGGGRGGNHGRGGRGGGRGRRGRGRGGHGDGGREAPGSKAEAYGRIDD